MTTVLDVRDGEAVDQFAGGPLPPLEGRLYNNAGVHSMGTIWRIGRGVEKGFEINVMGIVNGIRAFIPR